MDVRKRIMSLVLIPVLGLFATVALAGKPGPDPATKYAPSVELAGGNGTLESGVIKKCTTGTLFKNVDPFISGGNPDDFPVVRAETFLVDGEEVELIISWNMDNSFSYGFAASKMGLMHEIGVENNSDKIIYDYDDAVMADSGLNELLDVNADAEKANHVDICISPVDSVPPDVSIRVEPSSDGTTVSGIISIIATVLDESQPSLTDFDIKIVSGTDPNGPEVTPDPPLLTGPTGPTACVSGLPDCNEYTWTWDTNSVQPGVYTIIINAIDTSVMRNEGSGSLTVIVSVENCLEGDDGITGGEGGIQGCNPSGFQWVELPEELRDSGLLDGETLTQFAVPAKLSAQVDGCGGPLFPFVGKDPRWNNGVYTPDDLDLSEVFQIDPNLAVMRSDTRGEKCIALIFGEASFSFADFFDPLTYTSLFGANRYTYGITQLPEASDLGLPIPADIGPLGPNQIDLQKVPEATYQPTDRNLVTFIGNQLGPFTNDVFNPQRAKVPDFSYYVLGTVQICESLLGSGLSPADGRIYYEAVLQCSTDLAVTYFDDLDELLAYYGAPGPGEEACLISPSAENLRVELNKARSMIKTGNWNKADKRLNDLLTDAKQATWLVDERNCPGHAIMRIENLLWRNAQLELAESLLPPQ